MTEALLIIGIVLALLIPFILLYFLTRCSPGALADDQLYRPVWWSWVVWMLVWASLVAFSVIFGMMWLQRLREVGDPWSLSLAWSGVFAWMAARSLARRCGWWHSRHRRILEPDEPTHVPRR
ncbi:MAG: hypothetical protein RLZZ127_1152 [Planctomycetota bacterium]|jgi:hypothetical protein